MALKRKGMSLADEINDLMTTVPTNLDSDEDEFTKAKTVERQESDTSENEYQPSNIRLKTAPLLAEENQRLELLNNITLFLSKNSTLLCSYC